MRSPTAHVTPARGPNFARSGVDWCVGYAQQWSLGVQHQFGRDSMMDIGYVGSRGRQLVVLVDVNQAPATLGVTNANVNRPCFHVNPTLASVIQSTPRGTLDYHAVQARFVRRFSGVLAFQTSYTFGKAIDLDSETDGFSRFPDSYDRGSNRGPANYDQRHVLTSNWIYVQPFGRKTRLGGWQISGILWRARAIRSRCSNRPTRCRP